MLSGSFMNRTLLKTAVLVKTDSKLASCLASFATQSTLSMRDIILMAAPPTTHLPMVKCVNYHKRNEYRVTEVTRYVNIFTKKINVIYYYQYFLCFFISLLFSEGFFSAFHD